MFAVIGRGLFYEVAPNRFGSMSRAFFTLFQLITLDDWYYMYTDVLKANSSNLIIRYRNGINDLFLLFRLTFLRRSYKI